MMNFISTVFACIAVAIICAVAVSLLMAVVMFNAGLLIVAFAVWGITVSKLLALILGTFGLMAQMEMVAR